jgi:hypothetical protein
MTPAYALGQDVGPSVSLLGAPVQTKANPSLADGSTQPSLEKDEESEPTVQLYTEQEEEESLQAQTENAGDGAASDGAAPAPTGSGEGEGASIHATAAQGLNGATRQLPGLERIQDSFGRHDVSETRVQIGGPAERANKRLGAYAYTSGNRIAFKQEPDLRLASHEAAHIVQQRRGVHLKGGVSEAGDPYEQQADRAADAVVAGDSAEAILDEEPQGASEGGVQMKCDCGGSGCSACRDQQQAQERQDEPVQMQLEVTTEREKPEDIMKAGGEGDGAEATGEAAETEAAPKEEQAGQEEAAAEEAEAAAEEAEGAAEESVANQSDTLATATEEQKDQTTAEEVTKPQTLEERAKRESVAEEDKEKTKEEREEEVQTGPPSETSEETETASQAGETPIQRKQCDPPPPPPDREPEEGEAPPPDPPPGKVEENVKPDGPTAEEQSQGCGAEEMAKSLESAEPTEKTAAGAEKAVSSEPATAESVSAASAPASQASGGGAAAAGGAEQAQATGGGMEANIGQAEDGRAESVAAYEDSTAALDGASGAAAAIASFPVSFPKDEGATEADEKRRSEATRALENFLSGGSARVTDAISFAQESVPERVGAAAEAAKANVESAAATSSAALTARIAQARSDAISQASALRGQINAAHDASVATIESETMTALDSLDAEYNAAAEMIPQIEADQLTTLSDLYAEGDRRYREIGPIIGEAATKRGEYYAAHYDTCHIYKKDSFWDGYLTDRRADARMKAARDVAKGYKESLEKEANKQADEGVKGLDCDQQAVSRSAATALATLDSQYQSTVETLISAQTQAIASAGSVRDQSLSSADQALASALATFDQQEQTALRTIADTKYLQIVTIEQAAHMAAASLQTTILHAANDLGGAMRSVGSSLTSSPAPNPKALSDTLARGTAQVDVGLGKLYDSIESGLAGVEGQIASHGGQSADAVMGIGNDAIAQADSVMAGFSQTMAGLEQSAANSLGQLTDQHVSSTQEMTASAIAGFDQQVTGLQQTYETLNSGVAGRFEKAAAGLEAGLRDSLKGMDSGKDSIPHYADEAASKEAPAWKSVVKWVLIIAIIVVVALVIGPAVIGAVGAWAGSAFAGAVIGGAIVGAATGAAIQMLNNWETNTTWHEGVLKAAAIGAIGGAIGGGAGFLIGKHVGSAALQFGLGKVTQKAIEVGANIASDALLEIGTQLVTTGTVNWSDFGFAMLMSIATAGAGEIPAVKKVQTHVQTRAEVTFGGAPGARPKVGAPEGAPEAGGVKPPAEAEGVAPKTGAEPETAAPRPETEAEAKAPRPEAEAAPKTRPEEEGGTKRAESEPPRPEAEVKAETDAKAEAGKPPKPEAGDTPRLDSDPDMPANRRTDSELAEATTPAKVGDEDHGFTPVRRGDKIELWGCSAACGQIKGKLDEMINKLPPGDPLRLKLEKLRVDVDAAEARLTGGEQTKAIVEETGRIAKEFKALGDQHPSVGKGLDDPNAVKTGEAEPPTAGPKPVDMSEFGAKTDAPQHLTPDEFGNVKLTPKQDAIYILRDANGNILKVGKTSARGAKNRFSRYKKAGKALGIDLQLEVHPLKRSGKKAEHFESALRAKMEAEGHIMPWDNTKGRLGRPGFGTPLERGPKAATPEISAQDMTALLARHNGNVRAAADELGVHRRTLYLWAKTYNLKPGDFRPKKGP